MLQLTIHELGDPILRTVTEEVLDIQSDANRELIASMITKVQEVHGVGIAAPQVGHNKRICIIASHPNDRYPYAPAMEPVAMINPKIIEKSSTTAVDREGCLSIPGIRGKVARNISIVVEYTNLSGNTLIASYDDFVARIIQHEIDHLDGIVFLDRVQDTKDIITDNEFKKLLKG